jgi:hypothetical protein
MARARSPKTADRSLWSHPRLLQVSALLSILGFFLLAAAVIHHVTRTQVQEWERFTIPFAELDCPAPPGQDQAEFLAEVRTQADLPDRLHTLDSSLILRLGRAFEQHPAVERVEQLAAYPGGHIRVLLEFRQPVLEVLLTDAARARLGKQDKGETSWLVDRHGVLLKWRGNVEVWPLLFATTPPAAAPGQPWGDAAVEAAAGTAYFLRGVGVQESLGLQVFEMDAGSLVLCTLAGSRVLWGHAPGAEEPGEPPAKEKLRRLVAYRTQHGSLDQPAGRYEHDVRPPEQATHRPLPLEDR